MFQSKLVFSKQQTAKPLKSNFPGNIFFFFNLLLLFSFSFLLRWFAQVINSFHKFIVYHCFTTFVSADSYFRKLQLCVCVSKCEEIKYARNGRCYEWAHIDVEYDQTLNCDKKKYWHFSAAQKLVSFKQTSAWTTREQQYLEILCLCVV